MIATEQVLSERPLVIRRRVKWVAARASKTTVAALISAAELFYGALFGTTPQRAKHEQGFGTPSRALAFDFRRSLRPDDEFDMTVSVAGIHSRTYVLDVTARTLEGEVIFVATLTPVCVARDERRSIEIPAAFRQALEGYESACKASGRERTS